ncbi:ABC transporter family substrate-binding protein [Streptomyces sp. MP131-18]|uniref:ABC transporter family substrate-binding protein n=1 Tax=Streptomyces sp. MP131-18 TaxID=1857892 RepID=UPI00097BDFAB|nr:ABC transporter family substrate-binding protein [Streptomyces sp. MP131-18]ONK11629.1 putative monoacyl phosphatidylinositol tetramannoside-binding protein LpqW precursor [Streptomyces sp. MP131-18]
MSGASAIPGPARGPRRFAALAVGTALLVPLFAVAGCTGSEDRDRKAAGAAQSVATARRAQLTSGGTATWAVDRLPETLNAYQFDADRVTDRVASAVLPMLFTIDAHGRPQLNTDYLRSAEITAREPRQTVLFTLHPDAAWSDGEPVTAADFVAQWKALAGEDKAYWSARNAGYDRIENVTRGPEPGQVEVTFTKPYADWKSLFSPLYPRSVTSEPDRFNDGARDELPAAAGPFRVEGIDREAGTVTLVRNDAWWGEPALLDRLVLSAVPRDERRAGLLAGDLDIAEVGPDDADGITAAGAARGEKGGQQERPEDDAKDDAKGAAPADGPGGGPATTDALHELATARLAGADAAGATERFAHAHAEAQRARERAFATREEAVRQRLAGFTVHRAYDAAYTHLALNGQSPALADERVRWAVARALDRKELAEQVHDPAGLPTRALGSHVRVLGQTGYRDNSDALGSSGTDSAAALLEEAGWLREDVKAAGKKEDGDADDGRAPAAGSTPVRAKGGTSLELRFVLPEGPEAAELRRTGRSIVEMLAPIGVSAEIVKVDRETFFTDHIARGDFDLALFSWPATAYPATDAKPLFTKPRPIPGGEALIEQNYTRVGTDHIDQLLDQAAGELDEEEHDEILNRADARIWAAAGSVPLYQRPQLVAVRNDLAGAGAFGLATPRWEDIGYRK